MQRKDVRDIFIPGIKNQIPDINEVIEADQEAPKPARPYISFRLIYNGSAPWERDRKSFQRREVVSSSSNNFSKDVKNYYDKDVLLTVEHHIKDVVTGKGSVYVEALQNYWTNVFEDDVRDDSNVSEYGLHELPTPPAQFGPRSGTAKQEQTHVLEAVLQTTMAHAEQIPTIETVNIDPNSDLAAGESYDL